MACSVPEYYIFIEHNIHFGRFKGRARKRIGYHRLILSGMYGYICTYTWPSTTRSFPAVPTSAQVPSFVCYHFARVIILQTPAYNVYSSRQYAPPSLEDLDLVDITRPRDLPWEYIGHQRCSTKSCRTSFFSSFFFYNKRTCHAARRQPPTVEAVPLTLRVTGSARGCTSTRKCRVSLLYDASCRLNLGHSIRSICRIRRDGMRNFFYI